MLPDSLESAPKSRQDQILLLAAEGMTDKEIAAHLSLSPETVGTYWRRILSKYSAASRTEVVAKVIRLQAGAKISDAEEVSQSLQEVADHLLLVMSGRQEGQAGDLHGESLAGDSFHASPLLQVVVDGDGYVRLTSRVHDSLPVGGDVAFETRVAEAERDDLRDAFAEVFGEEGRARVHVTFDDIAYEAWISSFEHGGETLALLSLVPRL